MAYLFEPLGQQQQQQQQQQQHVSTYFGIQVCTHIVKFAFYNKFIYILMIWT